MTDEMRTCTVAQNSDEDEDRKGKGLAWLGFEVVGDCGFEGRGGEVEEGWCQYSGLWE